MTAPAFTDAADSMTTVARLTGDRAGADPDRRRDARILLAHLLGLASPGALDPGRVVDPDAEGRFVSLWRRRESGEPLQYILGEWDFYGRTFRVDPRALIPRPETEHLVEEARREAPSPRRIVDLGCGSGILAVTLALEFPAAFVVGIDRSVAALALARENVRRHGVERRAALAASDWLASVAPARFDLAVSNPPYVASSDRSGLPSSVRDFEPAEALFAGADGLSEIRRLLAAAPAAVVSGGAFLFEIGFGQVDAVRRAVAERPEWEWRRVVDDLAGIPRVAVLRRA
ncbi:MAG TPA: peptide chain release factor N(5)-glutamine methyltransferase [Thermoanaerobaculia bacterium]|nr:peptide chain release factor N(5)-glutamine methyltransferase [Thermoanaerobaculia bacterium]